ncbi:uncharacterized protein C17orf113-like [Ptychodera flava]|uniref:uncharacterized protein C17orf113-like n=1 Tax=Ptychodera flava TaxID=63121 RepID=UPI00396A84E4
MPKKIQPSLLSYHFTRTPATGTNANSDTLATAVGRSEVTRQVKNGEFTSPDTASATADETAVDKLAESREGLTTNDSPKKRAKIVTNVLSENSAKKVDSHTAMMRIMYTMAKNEMPDSVFLSLIELHQQNECKALCDAPTYKHHSSIEEMQQAIAQVINEDLYQEIEASPLLSVIVDETVNITVDKKLIMFLRIIKNGKPKNIFANIKITAGNAETVTAAIFSQLEKMNIDTANVIGLDSDGASVMTGQHNGVGVRMQRGNLFLTQIHCAAHRVALASSDATKGIEPVANYRRIVNSIYNYFEYSASRYERLRELNRALDNADFLSLKQPCSVRWLSLSRAVKAIKCNWPALIMELDEDPRNNPTADGILRQIKQFSVVALTHTLSDVLPVMERLNLVFQREDVNLSVVKPVVSATIASLAELRRNGMSGVKEQQFEREFRQTDTEIRGIGWGSKQAMLTLVTLHWQIQQTFHAAGAQVYTPTSQDVYCKEGATVKAAMTNNIYYMAKKNCPNDPFSDLIKQTYKN